jgi:hypothetical protein
VAGWVAFEPLVGTSTTGTGLLEGIAVVVDTFVGVAKAVTVALAATEAELRAVGRCRGLSIEGDWVGRTLGRAEAGAAPREWPCERQIAAAA